MIAVLCTWSRKTPIAGDDATDAAWFPIASLSQLKNFSEDEDTLAVQALKLLGSA